MPLNYNDLYANQPEEVAAQLPENFRAQLEEEPDCIIIDEEELTGEYPGAEILRPRAVDFRRETEEPESFSCRLELTGILYPEWDEEGPVQDEEGNPFFPMLAPFRSTTGKQSHTDPIPYSDDVWLKGFKSYRIKIDNMLEHEMIDKETYEYLNDRARAWVECIEENEGDTQAPYMAEDDEGRSLLGTMMAYLTTTYMDFELDIRPPLQYGTVARYGITNINVEPFGLKKLNQSEKVSSRKERMSKKGTPKKAPTSKKEKEEEDPKSNKKSSKYISRRR